MNKHKLFHRIGFALVAGLVMMVAEYVLIVSFFEPLASYLLPELTSPVSLALETGCLVGAIATVIALIGGTPWDSTLTIKETEDNECS